MKYIVAVLFAILTFFACQNFGIDGFMRGLIFACSFYFGRDLVVFLSQQNEN